MFLQIWFRKAVKAIRQTVSPDRPNQHIILKWRSPLMRIVEATQADVDFTLDFTATNAEGDRVPDSELEVEVATDNTTAVAVTMTGDRSGTLRFGRANQDGSPAVANLVVTVRNETGDVLGSFGEQFTITSGPASAIAGGTISIPALDQPRETGDSASPTDAPTPDGGGVTPTPPPVDDQPISSTEETVTTEG